MKQFNMRGIVVFCGTRGIPANYGGFETAIEEIAQRLVVNGYECEIICRKSSHGERLESYKDCKLIYVKGSSSPKLDTFISSIQTASYLWRNRKRFKHAFWFNVANLPGIIITRSIGIPMSVNTDGLEWRRDKWSLPFKLYYLLATLIVTLTCKCLISDSLSIQKFYKKYFWKATYFIPYGTPEVKDVSSIESLSILRKYNVQEGRYFLQITRLEPDNLPCEICAGFIQSRLFEKGFKFILIGYKDDNLYSLKIKSFSNKHGVKVKNAVYDYKELNVLRKNCFCYIHGNSVGGTNPALLEAMASALRVLAFDTPFNREVLGKIGNYFAKTNIAHSLISSLGTPNRSEELMCRVEQFYQWHYVAQCYMALVENQVFRYPLPQI